ncbi:4063_t:CDS:2, partial [Funneliformis mosseae]
NEDNWTYNKQKEHNTYLRTLGIIVATSSNEQRSVGTSALNNFTKEINTVEVMNFWKDVEKDRNAKEYEATLENMDMEFTIERTLEHNDYIREVGHRRRQVMATSVNCEGMNNLEQVKRISKKK